VLNLIVWKTGDRFGFLLRSPDGDLLQDAFAYDSEEEAIADAETITGDIEFRIEQYTNVGRLQYTDGSRAAHATDALAMARAEGLDV
jgi:pyruvate-formate lyase-activating enzyme